jgi:hypothetical protein
VETFFSAVMVNTECSGDAAGTQIVGTQRMPENSRCEFGVFALALNGLNTEYTLLAHFSKTILFLRGEFFGTK